jgi:C4-dicarboxylate-specific signal transduction histidine kinase
MLFDARQLQRWGISESQLPPEAVVMFRPRSLSTLWDDYRTYVTGALVIVALLTLLIVGLLVERFWRRRAEAEVEERRKEVTHLTRVAILGELSGALAHELNQPLTAILSNAQAAQRLLAETPVDLDEVREILSDISNDDKRAGEVINRLRVLMKKGEAKLLPLNLNDLANDVLELAHSELVERNVALTTRLTPGLPDLRGDRVQLQQVLLNLIMNACEAMNETDSRDRSLAVSTARDGDSNLRLTVADRGPGISSDLVDRIFEPFVTTKVQGLGLGLSICRSIVAAHGGQLWVANNPDRGVSVFVSLPIHAGHA